MKGAQRIKTLFKEKNLGVKIDLGCGQNKQQGFIGVDCFAFKGVDVVQDLQKFPWKEIPDECASLVTASHLVEHIKREDGVFMQFMDEVWRILKYDGEFMISLPYGGSPGFWQDPTHVNGCNEITWTYFDPLARNPLNNQPYNLYFIYRPLPWEIKNCFYDQSGFMEVLLKKRRIDKSYGVTQSQSKRVG